MLLLFSAPLSPLLALLPVSPGRFYAARYIYVELSQLIAVTLVWSLLQGKKADKQDDNKEQSAGREAGRANQRMSGRERGRVGGITSG